MSNKAKMKRNTGIVGSAGEHLVAGELLRRGVTAALTPRNAPAFDILATDAHQTVHIRVKTKTDPSIWRWNASSGAWKAEVFRYKAPDDYCILVDLCDRESPPTYFILDTRKLEKVLQLRHKHWLEGKRSRSTKNKMRSLRRDGSFLKKIKENNWSDLGLRLL